LRIILCLAQHNTNRIADISQKINNEVKDLASKRSERPPTQQLCRLKLKQCAHRYNFLGAPWVVHENIARRFGIWKPLPLELAERIKKHLGVKKQRLEPKISRRSSIPKGKRITEDLLLYECTEKACHVKEFSPVNGSLPMYSDIFLTYDFCQRASKELRIERFTMAEFEDALLSGKESKLLMDVNLCLLEALRKDCPTVLGFIPLTKFSMESLHKYVYFLMERPMESNPLAELNPIAVDFPDADKMETTESEEEQSPVIGEGTGRTHCFLVNEENELLPREVLESESYWSLDVKHKIIVFRFLMDHIMDSTVMRQ